MHTIILKSIGPRRPLESCLIALAICFPLLGNAQYHSVFVYNNASGPDGTPRAHVGDIVSSKIGVINLDDYGDTVTITNLQDTVHHGMGDTTSPNLLAGPVVLQSYIFADGTDTLEVSNSYLVLPGDGEYLSDHADVGGTENFDGLDGFDVPGSFESIVGAQVRILCPSIQLAITSLRGVDRLGTITYGGSVSNSGNTLLAGVVVSNLVNGSIAHVLGPTDLSVGQVIGFTGIYVTGATSEGPAQALVARGTDELGLTVSDSAHASPTILTATRTGGGIRLQWNSTPGRMYQLEYTTNLSQTTWNNLGEAVYATNGSMTMVDSSGSDARRFYRVGLLP